MAYKSFIPTPVGEYQFKVDDAKLHKVAVAFKELNDLLPLLSEEERLQLIRMEANDSWRLADERSANPFSFAPGFDKENVDNIVRATVYGEEALEELPPPTPAASSPNPPPPDLPCPEYPPNRPPSCRHIA